VTRVPLATLLALTLSGCAGPLSEAEGLFDRGQYPAAKQALLELDADRPSWSPTDRAEYALYRGLTLLALGNDGRARPWLAEAKAAEDASPGTLRYDDLRRLSVALESNPVP
jgi:hypothetical protein